MYKLAAFDLDGTIADTLRDLAEAVNYAMTRQGLKTYPVDDYRHFVGNGVDNLMMTVMGGGYSPEAAERAKADFYDCYAGHCLDYTAVYPGIAELLSRLSADGVMTAVISNKPHAFVPRILSALYPGHSFTYASGQRGGAARKPAPDALLSLMAELGVSPRDTLYIGDSDVDVAFAHAAGVKVCGVSWGFRGAGELISAGADMIADTVGQLTEYIYEQA